MAAALSYCASAVPPLSVVACARTVLELLSTTTDLDLVVLDPACLTPGSDPFAVIAELHEAGAMNVVVFTSDCRSPLIRKTAQAGIAGLLDKDEAPETIAVMIHTAAMGRPVCPAQRAATLAAAGARYWTSPERRVLERYARGERTPTIAAALHLDESAVCAYLSRIKTKIVGTSRHHHNPDPSTTWGW
ncbi:LuxR C-terminal-related transcriptional regulator [Nocardia fluminea]|uniref:LuxR C-terminal-related transcriptional regulator n=1 Tax=Nocardia fluminea TaxID=134984 RepID=UPI003671862C